MVVAPLNEVHLIFVDFLIGNSFLTSLSQSDFLFVFLHKKNALLFC